MAAAVPPDRVTVHDVLFGDIGSAARIRQVARALDEQAAAKGHIGANLTAAGYGEFHAQLARLVDGMVNADLGALILTAWSTWDRLVEAADATACRPERTELVTLDEQRIVSERTPAVDVLIDGEGRLVHVRIETRIHYQDTRRRGPAEQACRGQVRQHHGHRVLGDQGRPPIARPGPAGDRPSARAQPRYRDRAAAFVIAEQKAPL